MNRYYTLNSSHQIPSCGLGTYKTFDEHIIYDAIKHAGIRLIDTAQIYENEKYIGLGIKKALDEKIVKREELFIITKLWNANYSNAEETLKRQLIDLQLDYIDLYLIHWPLPLFDTNTNKYEKISMTKL